MPCVINQTLPTSNLPELHGDESIILSGILEVISYKSRPRVLVVVHRTTTEHFAVFYPLRLVACARKPLSTINLKSSVVKNVDHNLINIRPRKDVDGISLTLKVVDTSSNECEDWVAALSDSLSSKYSVCLRSRPSFSPKLIKSNNFNLPTVMEDIED